MKYLQRAFSAQARASGLCAPVFEILLSSSWSLVKNPPQPFPLKLGDTWAHHPLGAVWVTLFPKSVYFDFCSASTLNFIACLTEEHCSDSRPAIHSTPQNDPGTVLYPAGFRCVDHPLLLRGVILTCYVCEILSLSQ